MDEPPRERPEPERPPRNRCPRCTTSSEREEWLRQAAGDARRLRDEDLSDHEGAW
ncbi:hypothetical protein [Nocardiopsis baichengensis]|uniref:hypothetical protein n=1 Tax=Nocardiopsis baichengensis TaxID=280240 RepID=UPI000347098D|nr:hypothetical protein [Nocardiopsis baichengensis]